MSAAPKRQDHPWIAYFNGFILVVLALIILLGVVHHLTVSHHGPGLLRFLLAKHQEATKSEILDETQQCFKIFFGFSGKPEDERCSQSGIGNLRTDFFKKPAKIVPGVMTAHFF